MAAVGSLQLSNELGICKSHRCNKQFQNVTGTYRSIFLGFKFKPHVSQQNLWNPHLSSRLCWQIHSAPYRYNKFKCHSSLSPGHTFNLSSIKATAVTLARSCNNLQGSTLLHKLAPAVGIVAFAIWGLGPLMRQSRNVFLRKSDNNWQKSGTYHVMTFYLQPLLLWTGALLVCRALDPVILPTEPGQIVKQRLLNFVRSLSTVLAFAYCLSSVIQQAQKFLMETNDPSDARNMGFSFAGKAMYTAVWIAAVSLFMELLGFSTQKWLTAGGLGTVLLTLAGREIFTNFLSSAMIHATRPFVLNEWIQTKIEGYEVSGTVEHVGWWSPTIIRGEDREAVHIPNHKFTVNVVRNLTQKTHWRIKTHLAISHLDVNKINIIVADMRKVLAKNPQVEQQKLHRRVFLDNVSTENQALLILVSCFVKTSHFEEYLCVKEAILLDLLRVIRHHRARLATPIRTVQKVYSDADMENIPYADSIFNHGTAASHRMLLIDAPYKINGEDRTKSQSKPRPASDSKSDAKGGTVQNSDLNAKETIPSKVKESSTADLNADTRIREMPNAEAKEGNKDEERPSSDPKFSEKPTPISVAKTDERSAEQPSNSSKLQGDSVSAKNSNKQQPSKVVQAGSPSATLSDSGGEKPVTASKQPKQEDEKRPTTIQSPSSKPVLEDNIVLGVALEGSKRTLPIEEGMVTASNSSEAKELATIRRGHHTAASVTDKDKKESKKSDDQNSTCDQLDEQD